MNVLKGPADAGNYRIQVGRYRDRWYVDPLPACDIAGASGWQGPSVSATKPPFANKYVPMKSIAEMADDEWTRLATKTVDDRYEAIKAHDKRASRINMDRGSLIHLWAEDLLHHGVIGEWTDGRFSADAVEQAKRFRPALEAFFDAHQPELVAAEVVCLHRTLNDTGYGGTADAFVRIEGDVWAVDWKSRNSDHAAYLEEAAQGGAYIGAEYMIVAGDDGGPVRVAVPDVAGVLIVSIREDGARAYPIDGDGAIRAYREMHRWWCAQQDVRENGVIGKPWAPKAATKIAAPADSPPEAGEQPAPDGTATAPSGATNRRTALLERYNALSAADREAFDARKPEGADLDVVELLIEAFEHPPSMLDQAQQRMADDADRRPQDAVEVDAPAADGTDNVLSALAAFLDDDQRLWVGSLTSAPISVGRAFRYSYAKTQRNADICIALARFAGSPHWDAEHDEGLRAAIYIASSSELALQDGASVPDLLAQLDATQAAEFKNTVDAISGDLLTLSVDAEGAVRWTSRAA